MKRSSLIVTATVCFCAGASLEASRAAAAYKYIFLDPPNQGKQIVDSRGLAINDAGQVLIDAFDYNTQRYDAWVWRDGVFTKLAFFDGAPFMNRGAISPWGLVVGDIANFSPYHGFAHSTLQKNSGSDGLMGVKTG